MEKRALAGRHAQVMCHLSPWSLIIINAHNVGVVAAFITAPQQRQTFSAAATETCRHCCNLVHWRVVMKVFKP